MRQLAAIIFIGGLLVVPRIVLGDPRTLGSERYVAEYAKYHHLTTEQFDVLKRWPFMGSDCINKPSSCRPYIDFASDCGVNNSVTGIESYKKGEPTNVIPDVASLG